MCVSRRLCGASATGIDLATMRAAEAAWIAAGFPDDQAALDKIADSATPK